MAVYERTWRRYDGPLVSRGRRFQVVPRYALAEVLHSRAFIVLYIACFVPLVVFVLTLYLRHNVAALALLGLTAERVEKFLPIDGSFFLSYLRWSGGLTILLALAVGPGLVSHDLRNNGLALYFARPLTRSEYVLGKLSVLALLMSLPTWIAGLGLFLFQGFVQGGDWMAEHRQVALAIFVASWVWIASLSLFTLAVSAWVRWKPLARIVLVMLLLVLAAVSNILRLALNVSWGGVLSFWEVIGTIWSALFGLHRSNGLSPGAAWAALFVGIAVCLGLLWRRVRAYEVVR